MQVSRQAGGCGHGRGQEAAGAASPDLPASAAGGLCARGAGSEGAERPGKRARAVCEGRVQDVKRGGPCLLPWRPGGRPEPDTRGAPGRGLGCRRRLSLCSPPLRPPVLMGLSFPVCAVGGLGREIRRSGLYNSRAPYLHPLPGSGSLKFPKSRATWLGAAPWGEKVAASLRGGLRPALVGRKSAKRGGLKPLN